MGELFREDILLLDKFLSVINDNEPDTYKKLLMKRIASSFKATNLLIENDFGVEAPVLIRVALEHVVRLMYVHQNPNYIEEKPDIHKFFGKGVKPTKAIDKMIPGLKSIYELLSAFIHPDMLSLVADKVTSQTGAEFLQKLIFSFVIVTLVNVYPYLAPFVDLNKIMEYITLAFVEFQEVLVQETTKEALEMMDIRALTASENANQLIGEYLDAIKEGMSPEQIIREKTSEIVAELKKANE